MLRTVRETPHKPWRRYLIDDISPREAHWIMKCERAVAAPDNLQPPAFVLHDGVRAAALGRRAPRQERSVYQPLARTDYRLGRPQCAAWRFDLARIQLGGRGTGG